MSRRGLTLIEIIIALVIMGGVIAILGEMGRMGLRNAMAARDSTQAELICESLIGMIRTNLIPLETNIDVPLEDDYPDTNAINPNNRNDILWYYSVEVSSTSEDGLLEVAVTVRQNKPDEQSPVSCRMIRWMIDPVYLEQMQTEMDEILNPEDTTETTTTSSTGQSPGSSTTQ